MFLLPKSYWQVQNTKDKGKGVFANRDIPAGLVIGDYTGKFIRVEDEEKYEKKYGFYIMYYSESSSIVPDLKKDGIHLINHSCTPNVGFYTYKGHTIYFSLRKIFKGEEFTTSYQLSPQDKDCSPCTHLCFCGSFICTQTMHLSKTNYDKWIDFDAQIGEQTKKIRAKVGQEVPVLPDYPQEIPDYPIYALFGSSLKKPAVYNDSVLPDLSEIRARIRQTGRYATFKKLGFTIYGIMDNVLITRK